MAFSADAFTPSQVRRRARGVFYGWWLVPISGTVHTITSVPLFHAMGLWFVALEAAFGWNRTQLSLAFSFTRIEGGILGPVEGYLVDRMGVRRMALIGLTILAFGFLVLSQVRDVADIPPLSGIPYVNGVAPLMFYIAFMIMALGQGFSGWLPMNTMLNNWFSRNKAKAMGISSAIGRLWALAIIPAMAWAVDPAQDNFGWRSTALLLAAVTILLALPLAKLIRNRPEDYGLLPDGDPPPDPPQAAQPAQTTQTAPSGPRAPSAPAAAPTPTRPSPAPPRRRLPNADGDFTLNQAMLTPAFWLIAFGQGFTSMTLIAMMAHLAPMLVDQGVSVPAAGWVVTTYTALSMLFQVVGGYIGDRISKRVGYFCFTTMQAVAVVLLVFSPALSERLGVPDLWPVFTFAVLFGIGFGGRNPLSTSIRGEYFGRSSFGKIMGMSQLPMNLLLLVAPLYAGYMRDTMGSYDAAFLSLAALNFLGGAMFLFAKKPTLNPNAKPPRLFRAFAAVRRPRPRR